MFVSTLSSAWLHTMNTAQPRCCWTVVLSDSSFSWQKSVLCPARRQGANKRYLCLSVRLPSVAYIVNNSRTQRPSAPKFGRKVPHFRCDSHTSFKVKRSKVKIIPGPLMLAHVVCHILRMAIKAYGLQTWYIRMEDDDRISHRRHDLQGQRSRSQGHVISLSRLGPMLYLCRQKPVGAYRVGRIRRPHFLLSLNSFKFWLSYSDQYIYR